MIINFLQGNISIDGKLNTVGKPEYHSATLPSKKKTVMKKGFHSVGNFAKMPPEYEKSADDIHVNQVRFIVV